VTVREGSSFNPANEAARILAAVVESSDDAIIVTDLDGTILTWNGGASRLYGYDAANMRGRSIALLVPESHRSEFFALVARLKAGEGVKDLQTVRRTKNGGLVDVSIAMTPVVDANGVVIGATKVARDISARKLGELAQRNSEIRWRSVIESAVDGILVIDDRGRIEAFNPAAERLFGYAEADVLGRNVKMLMPSPYHEEHDGYLSRYVEMQVKKIIGIGREVTGLRRDGTTFPLHLSVGEMNVGGERRFTGILHDLSARAAMEEQVREQAALAKLGEMAAVIAHEVKNPLAAVRGAIEVIGARLPHDGRDAGVVKEIMGRIDSLNDLMKDLLLFARPPQPKPSLVEIQSLVMSTAELLTEDPALDAVRVEVEGSGSPILADLGLLKLVILTLLVIGAHAMRGRGNINVSVKTSDDACHVAFNDSGPGIPPEIREKIFTPFFTTKSRGSGLGLPTAKRLIEAHRGTIDVLCPPGGGTTVTVRLPARK
jgi:two-component system sensor kinase FixL